jgi:hypothetical protein
LGTYRAEPIESRNNTLVDGALWGAFSDVDIFQDTVLIEAGEPNGGHKDGETSGNAYYGNTENWESDPAIQRDDGSAANMEEFCVTIRGYTDPTEKCFPNAVRTSDSPHEAGTGFEPPTDP